MPKPEFKNSPIYSFTELQSPDNEEIKELLSHLQHSQNIFTKFMNVEICALAETMDHFLPGFWNRFLENRHQALKQFLEYKQNPKNSISTPYENNQNGVDKDNLK